MNDKKQSKAEQRRWHKLCLLLKEHWHRILLGVLVIAISYCICSPYLSPEQRATNNDHTHLGWYLIGLAFIGGLVLYKPQIITSNPKKYFITRVLVTGITGGTFALLLPIAVKSTTTGVGGLRHSILLATGGLLAILTLGETRRKNDIDKRKNKQEKKKNDKDHRRQVRAERRERYTKAVEQLGDEKAPIRMGGVYTLVGLVDEWLEDESIEKYEDRLKEGQVIINNLCAYIRSPFTLASHYDELSKDNPTTEVIYKNDQQKSPKKWQIISNNLYACIRSRFTPDSRHDELSQDSYTAFYKDRKQEFYADKATLESEADVRLSIIKEIHDRLQGPEENTPGTWSDFEYDFSGSTFFYPIDLTCSNYNNYVDFSNSKYFEEADFSGSIYLYNSNFENSIYKKDVAFSFSDSFSVYNNYANFTNSIYKDCVELSGSIYNSGSSFADSTYNKEADFGESIFKGQAFFTGSTYMDRSMFYGSIFYQLVDFSSFSEEFGPPYIGRTRFTTQKPDFYSYIQETKNLTYTLLGTRNNNFQVDINQGYSIVVNTKGLPDGCLYLSSKSGQKESLENKFQEIEKINNKLLEVKDIEEKAKLLDTLRSLYKELHKWREKVTTVKVEDGAIENTES